MNLTQRQLRMFVATAGLMNISRASQALHISQPALSRALQELEAQLGVKLLLRTTRHLSLTHDGERFLPVAQRLLRDLEQATTDLREQATGLTGSITLAVGSAFGCAVLPAVISSFSVSHPGVQLRLVDDNSAGISSRVRNAQADLGIGSAIGDISGLTCTLLLTAPLGLLGDPARFALTATGPSADISKLPLLREPADSSIMQALQSRGSAFVAQMSRGTEVSSLTLQLALARAGVGVAVVSALGASHADATGMQFVVLEPTVEREVFIMTRRDRELSPSARALAAAIDTGLAQAVLHPAVRLANQAALPF
ncbi:MAG: LysR family transcriptional regulator [Polaromonas sp.]|nr:LysR family transcriptional regulator [Polaromonas sp.]